MNERALPSEIGGYQVVGQLGQGSYGSVFRVRRPGLLRDFALKVLPADLGPGDLNRFRREARLVARLDHPHVVRGIEFGRDRTTGWHFLCLDLVEGPSLKQHLKKVGPLPWSRAIEIVVGVARAVDYAHQEGVIHRDLKPANVLLDCHGFARVTDFGLARDVGELTLTAPGEVLGTPYYMAPEQVRGTKANPLFDVHALGVMLFELVVGERPYEGKSIAEVVGKILDGQPPAASSRTTRTLPRGFDALCLRAMSPDPARRFQSARALADALTTLERAESSGAHQALALPVAVPESAGLPVAEPRSGGGAVLGAGVAAGVLLPLLTLSLVWGLNRGGPEVGGHGLEAAAQASSVEPVADAPAPSLDPPQRLAAALDAIEAWDFPRAELELEALRTAGRAPQEVENLAELHVRAVAAERAELAHLRQIYGKSLRGTRALYACLETLRRHPKSAGVLFEAAYLHAVCGNPDRAREALDDALSRAPQLGNSARAKALREALDKNLGRPPTSRAIWDDWRPYEGGLWKASDGVVTAEGYGLGAYALSGLLLVRDESTPLPAELKVQLSLGDEAQAYGGFLFGLTARGEGYAAYLVREQKAVGRTSDAERAELLETGRAPLFLRLARLEGGDWTSLGTRLLQAPDPGAAFVTFALEVEAHGVVATVGGIRERRIDLSEPVPPGAVGVLSYFGGGVSYRDFRCTGE